MLYNELSELAICAAVKASHEIMDVYSGENIKTVNKSDNSPLTLADIRANRKIKDFLKRSEIPIISEEDKAVGYSIRKTWKTCWLVDPLDGTKEFISRNGEFTVNIALVIDGIPVFGVIVAPAVNSLYFNIEDSVYICSLTDLPSELKLNKVILASKKLAIQTGYQEINMLGSRSHSNAETEEFIRKIEKKFKKVTFVSAGSSLKFCMLAEGKANLYPRLGPTMEWDTAAGHAIAAAAGFEVLDFKTHLPLSYNKENLFNPWFIVKMQGMNV